MKIGNIGFFALFMSVICVFSSCEEEIDVFPSLVTEDILYVSGERVRLLARIITTENINASDHGFYIADNEAFSNPIIVSLGERERPGRFIGETGELNIEKSYYGKSFIALNGSLQFGNTIALQTLSPEAFQFSPNNGTGGVIVNVFGKNFTADSKVFFGDVLAEILDISFESRITVRVPPIASQAVVAVKVVSQGKEMLMIAPFEYTVGKYTKLSNFPEALRLLDNIYFQEGNQFFVGLGSDRGLNLNQNIWKYSPMTAAWENTGFPGRPLMMSFSSGQFFGGGAYVLGRAPYLAARDFWHVTNGIYTKLPDLPFDRINSVAFEIGDYLYVVGGDVGFPFEAHRYQKSTGLWARIQNAPFSINSSIINFNFKNKQYFINPKNRELVAFDALSGFWDVLGSYPGEFGAGAGFGVSIGDRVYVGMTNRSLEMWELNMTNLNWVKKNNFLGSPIAINAGVFVENGLIYILRSPEIQLSTPMELWSFDPNGF
jgi:hypothetical protein